MIVSLGVGVLAGYVRWGGALRRAENRLATMQEVARPPFPRPLKDAPPDAVVDLMRTDSAALVGGRWDRGEAHGATSYRMDVTIPERVGDFATRGSAVLLEVAVDGYGEVSVAGHPAPVLGQNGASVVAGFNARNRVVLTRDAHPGHRIRIAVVGLPRARSRPAPSQFSIRSATLDFIARPVEDPPGVWAIVRLDPALDAILAPGARIHKVADGLRATEGPVWMPDGHLLFSDFSANLIYRWTSDDGISVFRTKSGHAAADAGRWTLPGSNGLAVDPEGRLTVAEHGRRRVIRLERDGAVTVLADTYDGRRLNSPNDLVYRSDGTLYFTDPPFGLPKGDSDPRRELPYSGVFRWSRGQLALLTTELRGPNGLAFSPDEGHLYVADWSGRTVVRYAVTADGTLGSSRVFLPLAVDGIKVDQRGNVYAAGHEGVWIVSPEGTRLGRLELPEQPSNLAWGDDDRRTLYVTARTGIYRIRAAISGASR